MKTRYGFHIGKDRTYAVIARFLWIQDFKHQFEQNLNRFVYYLTNTPEYDFWKYQKELAIGHWKKWLQQNEDAYFYLASPVICWKSDPFVKWGGGAWKPYFLV